MKTPLSAIHPVRVTLCVAGFACGTVVLAQPTMAPSPAAPTERSTSAPTESDVSVPLKHTDRTFVEDALESGRDDVTISKIAAERASSADVRQFAQSLVDEHARANDQLASFASAKNVRVRSHEKNEEKWLRKDPSAFDRDYLRQMISDHRKAIKVFTHESKDGADSDLVDFARKMLPTLSKHLERATELESMLK